MLFSAERTVLIFKMKLLTSNTFVLNMNLLYVPFFAAFGQMSVSFNQLSVSQAAFMCMSIRMINNVLNMFCAKQH